MKILILLFSCTVFSCTSPHRQGETNQLKETIHVPSDELIVPGTGIGMVSLGQDMQEVFKLLGKASRGDAGMGKTWSIWTNPDKTTSKDELAIYSAYRDSSMRVKEVKQIRITSPVFKTENGIAVGKGLKDIQAIFADAKNISAYLNNETKDSILLYDSKAMGIAFEFIKGSCTAITVHPKNTEVNATYLYPEWDRIK